MDSYLTQEEKNKALALLGYNTFVDIVTMQLERAFTVESLDIVRDLFDQLEEIDLLLREARKDSMALTTGEVKLSWGLHLTHLKSEGSRILSQMSTLLQVPLVYNKYKRSSSICISSY